MPVVPADGSIGMDILSHADAFSMCVKKIQGNMTKLQKFSGQQEPQCSSKAGYITCSMVLMNIFSHTRRKSICAGVSGIPDSGYSPVHLQWFIMLVVEHYRGGIPEKHS